MEWDWCWFRLISSGSEPFAGGREEPGTVGALADVDPIMELEVTEDSLHRDTRIPGSTKLDDGKTTVGIGELEQDFGGALELIVGELNPLVKVRNG